MKMCLKRSLISLLGVLCFLLLFDRKEKINKKTGPKEMHTKAHAHRHAHIYTHREFVT